MKITKLSTQIVHAYRCNWVFCVLETTDGIRGAGEGTLEMRERTVAEAIEELGRYLVGKDPFAIEHHVHVMHRDSYWRSGPVLRTALSAVEAAMFDIKGKALGVPVYELLGGKCRDRVPCYANGWFAGARRPEEFAAKARETARLGFRALKFDPFGQAYLTLTPAQRHEAYDIVEAVRDAVGPLVDLLIEVHGRLDVPSAVEMARRLERLRPLWYEEPLPPESLAALSDVRRRAPIAIAAGERYFEPQRFLEALQSDSLDFLQPDVCHIGGLLEAKKVANLGLLYGRPISPHNPNGPVCNAMSLQLAASTPNFSYLETMVSDVPWRSEVVREEVEVVDGEMIIPARPGLGVEVDEDAARKYPYEPRDLRHYNGDLTRIRPAGSQHWYRLRSTEDVSAGR
ncbi:MAG: mandelate racemase/muconate lactonizing enzyme family protein [Bryobacterales bacterium]|nr:mandelate racemase/muconate lactonizing enzyme family protein [Bryobacterales bacterium]